MRPSRSTRLRTRASTLSHLDRRVVRPRDADRAGRARGRLPVGRHDEPAEARRQGPDRRAGRELRGQQARRDRPDRRTRPGIKTPADLAKPGVKIIAAGDAVPITKYANQLVDNLAKSPGYPADFATAYNANIVSKEDNVKAVVAKLELGEGDAGIVYVTDAKASTQGRTRRGRPDDGQRRWPRMPGSS